jgi:excisionase family DNA binding protein
MTEKWSSVDEVAAHLGVARETLYRWIGQKALPAHKVGKFWKFKISEVDDWARAGGAADRSTEGARGNTAARHENPKP